MSETARVYFGVLQSTDPRDLGPHKIADNFTSLRNLARERHVSPARPFFLRGRPISPRVEVVEKEKPMRCMIMPVVSLGQR